mmetsp:Transcript_87981/g.247218  ORF Transcript_87981/g.247218 Transcript_87981/m.247218 type:complete len:336 (-) Transcript_87981:512-1519(-)
MASQNHAVSWDAFFEQGESSVLPIRRSGPPHKTQSCPLPGSGSRHAVARCREVRPGPQSATRRRGHIEPGSKLLGHEASIPFARAFRGACGRRRVARVRHFWDKGVPPGREASRRLRSPHPRRAAHLRKLRLGPHHHERVGVSLGVSLLGYCGPRALKPHEHLPHGHPYTCRVHVLTSRAHRESPVRYVPRLVGAGVHVVGHRHFGAKRVCRGHVRRTARGGAVVHGGNVRRAPRHLRRRLVLLQESGLQGTRRSAHFVDRALSLQLPLALPHALRLELVQIEVMLPQERRLRPGVRSLAGGDYLVSFAPLLLRLLLPQAWCVLLPFTDRSREIG